MLKRKNWPSNPYICTRSDVRSVTVIAFAKTPTGRWAKCGPGGPPRYHATAAYAYRDQPPQSEGELTIRAIEHWNRTAPKLPNGYDWTDLGIY